MLAAGPEIRTIAAKSIPGFSAVRGHLWARRAPLGSWDVYDSSAVADTAMALLSPLLRGTTASVVYVDGGFHSMGWAISPLGRRTASRRGLGRHRPRRTARACVPRCTIVPFSTTSI